MADITMCTDEQCSRRFSCYRFTAPWNEYGQSIFAESPRKEEDCEWFWDNKGRWLDKQHKQHEKLNDESY